MKKRNCFHRAFLAFGTTDRESRSFSILVVDDRVPPEHEDLSKEDWSYRYSRLTGTVLHPQRTKPFLMPSLAIDVASNSVLW